jgi:hypothetical protein
LSTTQVSTTAAAYQLVFTFLQALSCKSCKFPANLIKYALLQVLLVVNSSHTLGKHACHVLLTCGVEHVVKQYELAGVSVLAAETLCHPQLHTTTQQKQHTSGHRMPGCYSAAVVHYDVEDGRQPLYKVCALNHSVTEMCVTSEHMTYSK